MLHQNAMDPVALPGPLPFEAFQFPVEVPGVLVFPAGHPHHPPQLLLPTMIPDEHSQELAGIDPVSFGPPQSPVHFQTGLVHHHIIDASTLQVPVQPETVTSGLIATHHGRCTSYAKMGLGSQKGTLDLLQVPRRHGYLPDLPAIAARHFPGAVPQLEGHVQNGNLVVSSFSGVACFWSIVSLLPTDFQINSTFYIRRLAQGTLHSISS